MAATTFRTATLFRAWLERHHGTERELLVRLFKVHASHRGLGYAQALDEALCVGWIDGVRRSFDEDSFTVRFTPRKPTSIWSAVNIRRVAELESEHRMRPSGAAAFQRRTERRSRIYAYESKAVDLSPAYAKQFRASERAWAYFQAKAPGYRRTCTFWVMSAKQEATRERRLALLIACSAKNTTIPHLTPNR